jgi:hypothetical protein
VSVNKVVKLALEGKLLARDGRRLAQGVWESAVYLGSDGFVYHLEASREREEVTFRIARKSKVGDYLRWVDDIFNERSGRLPAETNKVHYQASLNLREMI